MWSIQSSLFNGDGSEKLYIDGGCFSRVYSSASRPDFIIKQGRSHDGALAWLMWCERNQGRKGVPVIESLVLIAEGGYLCTMKRYEGMRMGQPHALNGYKIEESRYWRENWDHVLKEPVVLEGPGKGHAFGTYGDPCNLHEYEYLKVIRDEFQSVTGMEWDDVHHGNYMWCTETGTIVMLDPSSSGCDPHDIKNKLDRWSTVEPFTLTMQ